jgi:hypothetical protein
VFICLSGGVADSDRDVDWMYECVGNAAELFYREGEEGARGGDGVWVSGWGGWFVSWFVGSPISQSTTLPFYQLGLTFFPFRL